MKADAPRTESVARTDESGGPPPAAASVKSTATEGGLARDLNPDQAIPATPAQPKPPENSAGSENPGMSPKPNAGRRQASASRLSEAEVRQTLDRLRAELLQQRTQDGHWEGQLAASALSTATAVSAMSAAWLASADGSPVRDRLSYSIKAGTEWLIDQQNTDGGFGDTDRSHSNIATSYLVLAALHLSEKVLGCPVFPAADQRRLQDWIDRHGGLDGLRARYGKDKTFVVPILTNLAIAGCVSWDDVPALPFEAAVLPQSWYRFVGMPVVSYAIPALVAIGQAKFFQSGTWPVLSALRRASVTPTMKVLRRMQPASGGYLEATPLTAFVAMSLAASGRVDDEVTAESLRFLQESMRADGSWPIDTDLAMWVTSLAGLALSSDPADEVADAASWRSESLAEWMLGCQHRGVHPFTGARPGGWGWTDLSGAVPDADDTPAAILSLWSQRDAFSEPTRRAIDRACFQGIAWLLKLQNRDGGWPTFCRGWGKLPFDRSSTDLTAHALRAIRIASARDLEIGQSSRDSVAGSRSRLRSKLPAARQAGLRFLRRQQTPDGSWAPLWFGNQDRELEDNPIYGTARVLLDVDPELGDQTIRRGVLFLIEQQNADGGWGGGPSVAKWFGRTDQGIRSQDVSTVEETAIALEALASLWDSGPLAFDTAAFDTAAFDTAASRPGSPDSGKNSWTVRPGSEPASQSSSPVPTPAPAESGWCDAEMRTKVASAMLKGTQWLLNAVDRGEHRTAWPIGFYFAKLWYYERLYPLIFATAALGRVLRCGVVRSPETTVFDEFARNRSDAAGGPLYDTQRPSKDVSS